MTEIFFGEYGVSNHAVKYILPDTGLFAGGKAIEMKIKRKISILFSLSVMLIIMMLGFHAYAGSLTDISSCTVTLSQTSFTYDTYAKRPDVTVTCTKSNGKLKTLEKDKDYTVKYDNSYRPGTATCTVSGINNYTGSVVKTYRINQKNIGGKNISAKLEYRSVSYTGSVCKPTVSVAYQTSDTTSKKLKKGTDFTVTYTNNKNAGTATVTINGIGNYKGTKTLTFTINPRNIESKYISIKADYTKTVYSGKKKEPKITASFSLGDVNKKLKKGTDYTVTYSNNKNLGRAIITIKGIGNYCSETTRTFVIIPKKTTGLRISERTTESIKLKWNKNSNVSGYEIYQYNYSTSKFEYFKTVSASKISYNITSLSSGKKYSYKIKAYITIGKKKYYGKFSESYTTYTKPAKVGLRAVTKSGSSITIHWNQVACSGYQIMYSTNKDFKSNVKTVLVSGGSATSKTIGSLNSSKTYYAKVRAYAEFKNKKFYGQYSSALNTNYSHVYATYTSSYVSNKNRTTNLKIASDTINGTVIMPGETFSFNQVVGKRTAAKGYKKATVFTGSTSTAQQLGGGVCQVASTMFNCALKANVKITERHQHSQRVSYVPLGRDASIYWGGEDFKWMNNTGYPIKIKMTVSNGKITATFLTCTNVNPKDVTLKVSQSGKTFTLKRYVGGKVNYSCTSTY